MSTVVNLKYTLGGIYDKFIYLSLSSPFLGNRFNKVWSEGKQISMEGLPKSVFGFDHKVRGKMFGYTGPHLWFRHTSW